MATSTNYGWAEPDNTSLVKDGALAIRTLGNAIDTSLWNSGYGQAGKNKVINSAFQFWSRGTSLPGVTALNYTADRWQLFRSGTTISRQVTGDTTNLPFIQYCARVQRDSGTTGTSGVILTQSFETANSIPYAGKTVTFSFYARKGANYSAASSALEFFVYSGTGTDQNWLAGYTGNTIVLNNSATLTSTWQRFSFTGTVGATATELSTNFTFTPVGTAGVNDYYEITGVQLEVGLTATPFQTASGGSIQGELAMCQRYYVRTTNAGGSVIGTLGMGTAGNFTRFAISLPVTMRTAPSSVDFSGLVADDTSAGYAATAASLNTVSTNYVALQLTHSSGITQYRPYLLQAAGGGGYLGFSAEL
jgi:hypothetical protein